MHDHEHQGGQNDEHDHDHDHDPLAAQKGESSYGWLWIVGIIVVVAIALFFLQRNVPQDADVVDGDEAADEVAVDPLRAQPLGVYDLNAPSAVPPSSFAAIDWVVSTEGEDEVVDATYIVWGLESLADLESGVEDVYPNKAEEDLGDENAIPGKFETNIKAPESGVIYFRAVADVGGELYWTDEQSVLVKSK
ncbi:MAG TPA: hypothetical protein QF873_01530 [Patescibacteria group bacterium]|nr:hypothetical protein [Patescibacteria group bacterium]